MNNTLQRPRATSREPRTRTIRQPAVRTPRPKPPAKARVAKARVEKSRWEIMGEKLDAPAMNRIASEAHLIAAAPLIIPALEHALEMVDEARQACANVYLQGVGCEEDQSRTTLVQFSLLRDELYYALKMACGEVKRVEVSEWK